ncbi:hypothetical protein DB30_03105 [Enhygromyxa salina]|uniref:Uncharacterized protein n=1 Tax=Enhygromyxa salina TaxID=215803 RepID=A0A0C2CK56_9BACT|nr:hypothetical protein DB30_03105 [Enhygromyxa salina]
MLTAVTFASSAAKVILMAKRIVLESSIARILVGMYRVPREFGVTGKGVPWAP